MSEHELWNELGNLYFISGAYEPAIHAYARSIELDRSFGRPYSNMALAFVHTGRYLDAIELYHRSIELLSDAREKAITWNRLGILYRQVKDYQSALVAYEQADKLDSRQDEKREEASRDVKYPLFISMPPIDLNAILERPQEADVFEEVVNEQLETVETELDIDWFDGNFVPPNPVEEPASEVGEAEAELVQELTPDMEEEGWIPLVFDEAIAVSAPFEMAMQPVDQQQAEESIHITSTWGPIVEEAGQQESIHDVPAVELTVLEEQASLSEDENQQTEAGEYEARHGMLLHPDELMMDEPASEVPAENNEWAQMSGYEIVSELIARQTTEESPQTVEVASNELTAEETFENLSLNINDFRSDEPTQPVEEVVESMETELPFELQSVDANDGESNVHSTDTETAVEYSQVEYPLIELTPAEIDMIHIDIARFKRIIQINPRNAFAYDTLGGLYKSLGKFKDAITSYQQAIALDSTKPSYFYQLGLMYSAEKRDPEAMDAFKRVLSMDPGHILANASLGNYYRKMGLHDIARQHIDIAMQNVYEEENEYNQACLEAICGNTDRALELLQVAIEENPSYINWAQHDPDLDALRQDQRFYMLVQSYANR